MLGLSAERVMNQLQVMFTSDFVSGYIFLHAAAETQLDIHLWLIIPTCA